MLRPILCLSVRLERDLENSTPNSAWNGSFLLTLSASFRRISTNSSICPQLVQIGISQKSFQSLLKSRHCRCTCTTQTCACASWSPGEAFFGRTSTSTSEEPVVHLFTELQRLKKCIVHTSTHLERNSACKFINESVFIRKVTRQLHCKFHDVTSSAHMQCITKRQQFTINNSARNSPALGLLLFKRVVPKGVTTRLV